MERAVPVEVPIKVSTQEGTETQSILSDKEEAESRR